MLLQALGLLAALSLPADASEPASGKCAEGRASVYNKLVIIIDDLGHSLKRGREALALPGKITYAVIPYTPHAKRLATTADAAGKEVMVHAPMSTLDNTPLGRGGLTPDLSREEFRDSVRAALEQVPAARGINNHMGSDLTARRQQMAWLMQELRWRDLYFVDSRTSENTVAATVASEFRVPNLSRQVFLDNEINAGAIDARFQELIALAGEHGMAVGIGHPYPQTIEYLRQALPQLDKQGIHLAFVSEALSASSTGSDAETASDAALAAHCGELSEQVADAEAGSTGSLEKGT